MKKIVLFIATLCVFHLSYAKSIDSTTAKAVAKTFYTYKVTHASGEQVNLSLVYACPSDIVNANNTLSGDYFYYVFNVNNTEGFVIVSGDDIVLPILGYSNRGAYKLNNHSPAFTRWMIGYKSQIRYAIQNSLEATVDVQSQWSELERGTIKSSGNRSTNSVNPLVKTTWDQQPYYNADCPYDATAQKNCVTGCPATAMAQILKYWNYPAKGSGIHSYNTQNYGTLTADFGSTTYNWAAMPNSINSANNDIATLMYDCGVSVEMNYGPNESGGWVITAENAVCSQSAYVTYFGYDATSIQGLQRSNYSDADWKNLLKTELDNSRPVQYAGFGTQGGHTWVCDGYDANGLFDMNWGWSGIDDGYYDLDALNPGTLGTGGGAGGFNSGEVAVMGIKPVTGGGGGGGTVSGDIQLYSSITVTPNPINFTFSFTVNADVENAGTSSFSGTFCAALFDNAGNFITFIDSTTTGSSPLAPGYHYTGGITFSNNGLLTVPGTYQVGIFYRPTGGNWFLAGNTSYTNPISVTIAGPVNTNGMELYSTITPSPTTFTQGQAASVNVNILNNGTSTYYGEYEAVLLDLNNGSLVSTIGLINETNGLPSGYDYSSPYLTFSTSSLTAPPGTYILAIAEYDNTNSTWYYLGTTYFTNPILITVVAPPISPDIYEPNNSAGTAYNLPVSWNGNSAHVVTTGSNIHIDSDIDYYKVSFPTGYVYTINATVYDVYTNNTYTEAVLWSYNTGSGWSLAYDDQSPQIVTVKGAGTATFQVSPEFPGNTGTYVLDLQITRVAGNGIANINSADLSLNVFPNPANNTISISNPGNILFSNIVITNALGEVVKEIKANGASTIDNIDVSTLPGGLYFMQAITDKQKYLAKFIVTH